MAGTENNKTQNGCFAWLVRMKKSVNERWAKARNSLRKKLTRDNKSVRPLTAEDLVNETGTPDLIIKRIKVSPIRTPPCLKGEREDICKEKSPVSGPGATVGLQNISDKDEIQPGFTNKLVFIGCNSKGEPDTEQVRLFVESIINEAVKEVEKETLVEGKMVDNKISMIEDTASMTSSVISDLATTVVNESFTNIIKDIKCDTRPVIDDTSSLSSGALSDLATAVVNESMTNIIQDIEGHTRPEIDDNSTLQVIDDTSSSMSSGTLSVLADAVVTNSLTKIVSEIENGNQSARRSNSTPRTISEMLEYLQMDPQIGLLSQTSGVLPPCSP